MEASVSSSAAAAASSSSWRSSSSFSSLDNDNTNNESINDDEPLLSPTPLATSTHMTLTTTTIPATRIDRKRDEQDEQDDAVLSLDKLLVTQNEDNGHDEKEPKATATAAASPSYWNLLSTHKEYRLFLASYIVTHCGEWFNYVASMSVLEGSRSNHQEQAAAAAAAAASANATLCPNCRNLQISLLIVVRLLPNVLVSPLGGTLADSYDLRTALICLDVLGALVALAFWLVWAFQLPSSYVYVATFGQQCLAGLYDPCRNALVPQLIQRRHTNNGQSTCSSNDGRQQQQQQQQREGHNTEKLQSEYLQKATTLSGIVWSTMAAVGSSLGGFLVASFGVSTCFASLLVFRRTRNARLTHSLDCVTQVLDSLSYIFSAYLLWYMGGQWNVAALENESKQSNSHSHHDHPRGHQSHGPVPSSKMCSYVSSVSNRIVGMTMEGIRYMYSSPHGAIVLLKFSGALMFGASDVMNAAFASSSFLFGSQANDNDNDDMIDFDNDSSRSEESSSLPSLQSERLGLLFACVGIGAMLGPMLSDSCIDMERLETVQRLCVASFAVIALGYVGIGMSATFGAKCMWTIVRASGMAVSWIDSTLLLQKLMPAAMLGRVFAADTALATLGECISALYAGLLLDYAHLSANELALIQAILSIMFFLAWGIYHRKRKGAATAASSFLYSQAPLAESSTLELSASTSC